MPITMKPLADLATKYQTRAAAAAGDYAKGVNTTTKDWAANTSAAAPSWAAGVNAAVANNSFAKKVQAAGTPKWKTKAAGLGAQRYPQGVGQAGPAWQAGFEPFAAVIAAENLPPRAAKGNPANWLRSQQVGQDLHAKKLSG